MVRSVHIPFAALLASLTLLSTGCATFTGGDTLKSSPESLPDVANGARVTVELRTASEKSEMVELPMSDPMYVQQAVEQSGAAKKFRRMKIEVMRPIKGQRQKLTSKYAHEKGMVDPGYDYVLYPGDHLVIIEDPTTVVDDMLDSLGLPVKQLAGM